MDTQERYARFLKLSATIADAQAIEDILIWEARSIPAPQGGKHRARLKAHQAGILHSLRTASEYLDCVRALDEDREAGRLDAIPSANVAYATRQMKRSVGTPQDLLEQAAAASSLSQDEWDKARETGDGTAYLEALQDTLKYKRQLGAYYNPPSPYDGLLEEFEPGITGAEISARFDELKGPLQRVLGSASPPRPLIDGAYSSMAFPLDLQERLSRALVKQMGFEGRWDVGKTHPFMIGIHPGDTRSVIRCTGNDWPSLRNTLRTTTHEGGHCIYQDGLPGEYFGTAAGMYSSLGGHESQSRLWEVCIFGSRAGARFLDGFLRSNGVFSPGEEALYAQTNALAPSLIRIECDPAHYLLHIFLRFDLERALIEGRLEAKDIPDAWNEATRRYFGLSPSHIKEGYAQDPHWAGGSFGYFPNYALGTLDAAQLYAALRRDISNLDEIVAAGEFGEVREWLREQIWSHGATLSTPKLVEQATGEPPNSKYLLQLFEERLIPSPPSPHIPVN